MKENGKTMERLKTHEVGYKFRIVKKDGEVRWVEMLSLL